MQDEKAWPEVDLLLVFQITFVKALRALDLLGRFVGGSGIQHGEQCGDGAAAMAEGVLGFEIELGHGAVQCGEVEERVVAEAAGAARGFEDQAFDRPSAVWSGWPSRAATRTQR